MKFDSILGTIWLDASPDDLIGVSYTPIDESPLANQEILQTAKKQLLEFLAGARKEFNVPYAFTSGRRSKNQRAVTRDWESDSAGNHSFLNKEDTVVEDRQSTTVSFFSLMPTKLLLHPPSHNQSQ